AWRSTLFGRGHTDSDTRRLSESQKTSGCPGGIPRAWRYVRAHSPAPFHEAEKRSRTHRGGGKNAPRESSRSALRQEFAASATRQSPEPVRQEHCSWPSAGTARKPLRSAHKKS